MVSLMSTSPHYAFPHLYIHTPEQPEGSIPKSCPVSCLLAYTLENTFIFHCGLCPRLGSPHRGHEASSYGPHWVWGVLPCAVQLPTTGSAALYHPLLRLTCVSAPLDHEILKHRDHQSLFRLHTTCHRVWHIVVAQDMLVDWGTNE